MLRWTVVAALLVTLALGAAVLLVRPGGPGAGEPSAAGLDFQPADVVELRIERAGAPPERIVPAGEPGAWQLVVGEGQTAPWPVAASHVRSALRHLSLLTIRPDDAVDPAPDAATVSIHLRDGAARRLRLDGRALAGRVAATIHTPAGESRGWVDAALHEALVRDGPRAWRHSAALPLAGPDVSRITLQTDSGRLAFGRVRGRWALREPVAAPADPEAVGKLVAALAAVRVVDFRDGFGDAFEPPRTSSRAVVIEADRRVAGADAPGVERQELRLGAAADLSGQRLHATITLGGSGERPRPRAVIVEADSLASMPTDPAAYIARTALQTPAADIARVRLDFGGAPPIAFRRHLDTWTNERPDGAAVPVSPDQAKGLAALLALLTDTPAARIALTAPDADGPALGITVADAAAEPLERLELAVGHDASSPLAVRAGQVWRTYDAAAAGPVLEWLSNLAPPGAGAAAPLEPAD